jgi:Na+-transporting NADH:ubiquinone oxidoreductase subunit C
MPGILTLSNDSTKKTIYIALILCLICSIVVSAAAVVLKPIQQNNAALDIRVNILRAAGLYEEGINVEQAFEQIEPRVVELASGEYAEDLDPVTFDQRKAAKDPELSVRVPPEKDIASIKRKAKYATVYLVKEGDEIQTILLPVSGYGLWSTLYGFLALAPDTKTVKGLKFYEHRETPGLGGEVDNAEWLAHWRGKVVYDDEWNPAITVVKGRVDPSREGAEYQIDGLAGATLTSRGVMYLMQYWLSEEGFGPYLAKLREQGVNNG